MSSVATSYAEDRAREHPRVLSLDEDRHVPPLHAYRVVRSVSVPLVSHVPPYEQGETTAVESAPHELPPVLRLQPPVSVEP